MPAFISLVQTMIMYMVLTYNLQIDVGRYFLEVEEGIANPRKQITRVVAMGQQAVYGDLAKFGDADNAWGLVEFENGKVLHTRFESDYHQWL